MNSVASFFVEIEVEGTAFCSWGHVGPRSRLFCRCVALGVLDFVGHTHIWHWQCVTCRAMPKGAMDSSSSERCLPACVVVFVLVLPVRLPSGLAVPVPPSEAEAARLRQTQAASQPVRRCCAVPAYRRRCCNLPRPSFPSLPLSLSLSLSLSGSRWNRNRNRNGAAVVCRLPLRPLFDTPPHPTPVLAS